MNSFEFNSYLESAMDYDSYIKLVTDLFSDGKVTGEVQSAGRIEATRINIQRSQRLGKTARLGTGLQHVLNKLNRNVIFLVITEGWCGDSAQTLPWVHRLAMESQGKIEDRYVLRDENPELIDRFLTNGSRSVPVLIVLDPLTHHILGTWGPRPKTIQSWYMQLKKDNPDVPKHELDIQLHTRYSQDKGAEMQKDLVELLEELDSGT